MLMVKYTALATRSETNSQVIYGLEERERKLFNQYHPFLKWVVTPREQGDLWKGITFSLYQQQA
ncbi:hypothetical protein I7I48_02317 [Histoplasma ohiense]|nr:hypothetical protein I7I48_02317 [Histoplasma ohiense (nom. inval.)]